MKKLGHKIIKCFLTACGVLFIAGMILPRILAEYRLFALLFWIGNGITILIAIFAVIAFLNPILKKKTPYITEVAKSTLILHDLPPEVAEPLFTNMPNVKFFCATNKMAFCKGFYDCWLKKPGICVLHDGMHNLGKEIAQCDTFIVISKSLYGGFSRETKNALDRSISYILPFFHVRNRELHHHTRYDNIGTMRVYFYSADGLSEMEQAAVSEMVKAVGVNLDRQGCETIFIGDVTELSEVLV